MRVLFLGNSHTYYNDMPRIVAELAHSSGDSVETDQHTGSGVNLAWHCRQHESTSRIDSGRFDVVVLQERSGGPLEQPASMKKHAHKLVERIRAAGGTPLLYETWAHRSRPHTQVEITAVYREIADQEQCDVVPVGQAWKEALRLAPSLRLHDADDRHAAPAGSYLAACLFYTWLLEKSPEGLPSVIGSPRAWIELDPQAASVVQGAAARTVASHRDVT